MSMQVSELVRWLQTFESDDEVYIDDGGLTLQVHEGDAYIEVGGEPEKWRKFHVNVYHRDQFYDEVPTRAILDIPEEMINRILDMRKSVLDGNLYCAEVWDCTPDYRECENEDDPPEKWTEYEGRVDVQRLRVTDKEFQWVGTIKHTTVEVETSPLDIADLEE